MLRGMIVPRFPWGIPPGAIKGVPGEPYLAPLPLPMVVQEMDAVSMCWGCALSHLVALHTLYMGAGNSRVTERLMDLSKSIMDVLVRRIGNKTAHWMTVGARYGEEALAERGPLIATSEAGWWAVAAQASFALSAWYGLIEATESEGAADAEVACKLHRVIRAGMSCMYGDGPASRILDLATGDGAGDLLKLVAKVHVGLEVRP